MGAAAVLYVGTLELMRSFYEGCFGLTVIDVADDYCELRSEAWRLTLVRSPAADPVTIPAIRRETTPIKLAFDVTSIDSLRPVVTRLGGRVDPAETAWEFHDALHCDLLDPEGNVVQLIETQDDHTRVADRP